MLQRFKAVTFAFLATFIVLVANAHFVSVRADDRQLMPKEVQAVNDHPATAKRLAFDPEKVEEYRNLAAEIGMDYDKTYGYREWAESKRNNEIGAAGHYEMLNFSTEGDPENQQSMYASMREPHHWESFYFSNHDVTMLYVIKPASAGSSSVKILKIEEGRAPDIHQ